MHNQTAEFTLLARAEYHYFNTTLAGYDILAQSSDRGWEDKVGSEHRGTSEECNGVHPAKSCEELHPGGCRVWREDRKTAANVQVEGEWVCTVVLWI